MKGEIEEWKIGLQRVEGMVRQAEDVVGLNLGVVNGLVEGVEARLENLEGWKGGGGWSRERERDLLSVYTDGRMCCAVDDGWMERRFCRERILGVEPWREGCGCLLFPFYSFDYFGEIRVAEREREVKYIIFV